MAAPIRRRQKNCDTEQRHRMHHMEKLRRVVNLCRRREQRIAVQLVRAMRGRDHAGQRHKPGNE